MPAVDKETAFAELVRNYENQWIAIEDRGDVEVIVGAGQTAVEAAKEASDKGYPQAVLFKVPSFKARFVF
ncbi:MAG TPA: DUF5678 domain-containing protein [Pyrinomonadaceae bacterium]|nr:DUF5678 domain-containing protein [Pyrinomonadaceae bacterium]